jgi:hypothetical protein
MLSVRGSVAIWHRCGEDTTTGFLQRRVGSMQLRLDTEYGDAVVLSVRHWLAVRLRSGRRLAFSRPPLQN